MLAYKARGQGDELGRSGQRTQNFRQIEEVTPLWTVEIVMANTRYTCEPLRRQTKTLTKVKYEK